MKFITLTRFLFKFTAFTAIFLSTGLFLQMHAQTVNDVLENGIVVKGRDKIILKIEGDKIMYDTWHDERFNPSPLKDSSVFLVTGRGVNVYIKPFNPLTYSRTSVTQFTADQIQQDANDAFKGITQSLGSLINPLNNAKKKADDVKEKKQEEKFKQLNKKGAKPAPETSSASTKPCSIYDELTEKWKKIFSSLGKDQKKEIAKSFTQLKSLNFIDKASTEKQVEKVKQDMGIIKENFGNVQVDIDDFKALGERYGEEEDCANSPSPDPFIVQFVVTELAKQAEAILKIQTARLTKLQKAVDLVQNAIDSAGIENDGISWLRKIGHVELQAGKISNLVLTIYNSGFELSTSEESKDEIIATDKKEVTRRVLRMRKFQRFVPEVLPGTAYSFLRFTKFGTTTDASGKQTVSDAGEEEFKRVNFNVMLNFNYYVPNSQLHPFFQIGVGTNTDYPVFFTGVGVRINTGSSFVKSLSLSGGAASTWIKTLNKLKLGDTVTGTAQLEQDITHEFNWPPKLYLGFQIRL